MFVIRVTMGKLKKQATSDVTGYTYNLENKTTNRTKSKTTSKKVYKGGAFALVDRLNKLYDVMYPTKKPAEIN